MNTYYKVLFGCLAILALIALLIAAISVGWFSS